MSDKPKAKSKKKANRSDVLPRVRRRATATLLPIRARTFNDICKLKRDHYDTSEYWLMIGEGKIHIAAQKSGHPTTAEIDIDRRQFDRMVKWYVTGSAR